MEMEKFDNAAHDLQPWDMLCLASIFDEVNKAHFDDFLDAPTLRWNTRLRSSAGRFFPGSRRLLRRSPPIIEIASYLREEAASEALVKDTLAHEMIHYWLWVRKRPYGHTAEFCTKMKLMGVSRYNSVPRTRPYRYLYKCGHCLLEFFARKKLGTLACAKCCKAHAGGRYDPRFKLFLEKTLEPVLT